MVSTGPSDLSSAAKLARVVLANCGPLSPSEVADEAFQTPDQSVRGLTELADHGLAEPVCGTRRDREEVFALTPAGAEPTVNR